MIYVTLAYDFDLCCHKIFAGLKSACLWQWILNCDNCSQRCVWAISQPVTESVSFV